MQGAETLFEAGVAAIMVALVVSLPVVIVSLVVGLAASFFQGLTQIQDHTIGFVPRLLAVMITLALAAPWMGSQVTRFAEETLRLISTF